MKSLASSPAHTTRSLALLVLSLLLVFGGKILFGPVIKMISRSKIYVAILILTIFLIVSACSGPESDLEANASDSTAMQDATTPVPSTVQTPQRSAREVFAELYNGRVRIEQHRRLGTPEYIKFMDGPFEVPGMRISDNTPEEIAHAFMELAGEVWGIADAKKMLQILRVHNSPKGIIYVRFQQQQESVPVHGAVCTVSLTTNGLVRSYLGALVSSIAIDSKPVLSDDDAIRIASLITKSTVLEASAELIYRDDALSYEKPSNPYLSWAIEINAQDPSEKRTFYVDAHTGKIRGSRPNILPIAYQEIFRAGFNAQGIEEWWQTSLLTGEIEFTNSQECYNSISTPGCDQVCKTDACLLLEHVNMFDNYLWQYGIDSYSGENDWFKSSTHNTSASGRGGASFSPTDDDHANFWDGYAQHLDIVVHEWTHGLTTRTADLDYEGENAAISESLSDTVACLVDTDWRIGEDVPESSGLRCIDHPADCCQGLPGCSMSYNGIEHYDDRNSSPSAYDKAGITSKAAYLIINAIDRHKTSHIYLHSITEWMYPSTGFFGLRWTLLEGCNDLADQGIGGINQLDCVVVDGAFETVGIGRATIQTHPVGTHVYLDSRGFSLRKLRNLAGDIWSRIPSKKMSLSKSSPPIVTISEAEYQCISNDPNYETDPLRVVKTLDNPRVYEIVDDHFKREFLNWDSFVARGWTSSDIETVTQGQINGYIQDPYMPYYFHEYEDGMLVKPNTDPRVYIISQGRKKWIEDEEAFYAMGFDFADVQSINDAIWGSIPGGLPEETITVDDLEQCGSSTLPEPTLSLNLPGGRDTFFAGEMINIQVTADNYLELNVYFVHDNWQHTRIFTDDSKKSVGLGEKYTDFDISWTVPDVETTSGYILVYALNADGFTTLTGSDQAGPLTISGGCGDGSCDAGETCSSCEQDCGPCVDIVPGTITSPPVGTVVSSVEFDINWNDGYDAIGADTRTALFCRENGSAWDLKGGFGFVPPYTYYGAPLGGMLDCKIRTRLHADPDIWEDSAITTWDVSGDYAQMVLTDVSIQHDPAPNGCENLYVDATIRNDGSLTGNWRVRGFLHPAGSNENDPDALQNWPNIYVPLDPGQSDIFELSFNITEPLPLEAGQLEVTVIVDDYYGGYHGAESRATVQAYTSETEPPTIDTFSIIAYSGTPPEVRPGNTHKITFIATDNYALERFELHWREQGGSWAEIPISEQPEGACLEQLTEAVFWEVSSSLGVGVTLDLRIRVFDLGGRVAEQTMQLITGDNPEPSLTFIKPIGGEQYYKSIGDEELCAPIEFEFIEGATITRFVFNWTNEDHSLYELAGSMESIPENGHVEICLPTTEAGDHLEINVRIEAFESPDYDFYSPAVAVDFEDFPAPWTQPVLETSQYLLPPTALDTFPEWVFNALEESSGEITINRTDNLSWNIGGHQYYENTITRLHVDSTDYSLTGMTTILPVTVEESGLLPGDCRPGWLPKLQAYGCYSVVETAGCPGGTCEYDLYYRDVQAGTVISPQFVGHLAGVGNIMTPRVDTNMEVLAPSDAVLLPFHYRLPDITKQVESYRRNGSSWSHLSLLPQGWSGWFTDSGTLWSVREASISGGKEYHVYEMNEYNGSQTNEQVLGPFTSDMNIDIFHDHKAGTSYLLVSGSSSLNYVLYKTVEGSWSEVTSGSWSRSWHGRTVNYLYARRNLVRDGKFALVAELGTDTGGEIALLFFDDSGAPIELANSHRLSLVLDEGLFALNESGDLIHAVGDWNWNLENRLFFRRAIRGASDCDDSVPCTTDSWDSNIGACVNEPIVCPNDPSDLCAVPQLCEPSTGQCIDDPAQPGCDDGEFCNGTEQCDPATGNCLVGTPPVVDDGITCTLDSCDEVADIVLNVPTDDACAPEHCMDAVCDPQDPSAIPASGCVETPLTMPPDGLDCTNDTCDPATGGPVYVLLAGWCAIDSVCLLDGTDDPENLCRECRTDLNPYGWSSGSEGVACDDETWCTENDLCTDGLCVGSPRDCSLVIVDPSCQWDRCDEPSTSCLAINRTDGTVCNDETFCNGDDFCQTGTCTPTGTRDCDDSVSCTDDSCNETLDICDHDVNDAYCDNGDWCDGTETCNSVSDCQPGTPPNCDDSVTCTEDSCNETMDVCEHDANDTLCDNNLWCDGDETCDELADCQDGDDPCDPATQSCNEEDDICEPLSSCPTGHLCLTVLLHGLWNGTAHNCETVMDVYLYDGPIMVDSFFDVTFDVDGLADIDLVAAGVVTDDYTVLIEHLNHINLMTDDPVHLDVTIGNDLDFTDPTNVECGFSTMYYNTNFWTMPAGDIVPDDRVALSDFNYLRTHWTKTDPACDLDCDGFCRLGDFNKLRQTWNTQGCATPE